MKYFLGFSRVTGICLWPCLCCILAEYNLARTLLSINNEGYLVSKFPQDRLFYNTTWVHIRGECLPDHEFFPLVFVFFPLEF